MSETSLLYKIARIALVIVTFVQLVCLIWTMVEALQNNVKDGGYWAWLILFILITFIGFWGAWKEDFWYALIFGICVAIFFFTNYAFEQKQRGKDWFVTAFPILSMVITGIYCFMLHHIGRRGSPPWSNA